MWFTILFGVGAMLSFAALVNSCRPMTGHEIFGFGFTIWRSVIENSEM